MTTHSQSLYNGLDGVIKLLEMGVTNDTTIAMAITLLDRYRDEIRATLNSTPPISHEDWMGFTEAQR